MTVLTKLKLTDAKRDVVRDPVMMRRQKLIEKLGEQAKLADGLLKDEPVQFTRKVNVKDAETGERKQVEKPKRVRQWFWHNLGGTWFLEVRFGNKVLELAKGQQAIEVGGKDKLPATIETVIEAVKAGELDAEIQKAGAKRKTR